MVSNKFLGALAVKLRLHTHLQHFSNPLQSQITHYAEEIQTAETENEGAVDYWVMTKDPPKVCCEQPLEIGQVCKIDQTAWFSVYPTWSRPTSELYLLTLVSISKS